MLKLSLSSSWTLAKNKDEAFEYSHRVAVDWFRFPLEAASEPGAKQRTVYPQNLRDVGVGFICLRVHSSARDPNRTCSIQFAWRAYI